MKKISIILLMMLLLTGGCAAGPLALSETAVVQQVLSGSPNLHGPNSSRGEAPAENPWPPGNEAGAQGVRVEFDTQVRNNESGSDEAGSGDKTSIIEAVQTRKASPEFLNIIVPKDADAKKPATGLLKTGLVLAPASGGFKLDFSLQNISGQDLSLYFSSGQKYDIVVTDQNGEEVYRWSHDKGFISVIVDVKLKKGEKLSFAEVWDGKDNQGSEVLPGKYTVSVKIPVKLKDGRKLDPADLTAAQKIEHR